MGLGSACLERTGIEVRGFQGHLLFPLSVLELSEEDNQATNVLSVHPLFWVQLWPPLGATLHPWLLPTKTASDAATSPVPSLCLQKAVFEDVPLGTVILRVKATDADSGRFALIQYSLGDGEGKFGINPNTVRSQPRPEQSGEREGRVRWSHLVPCSHTSPSAPS